MSATDFAALPDDARLWVFAASRPLSADESATVLARVEAFVRGWLAHGRPVTGAAEVRSGRFVLVSADERATGVSGCSIDSLFHTLGELEAQLGVNLRDSSTVLFRGAAGELRGATRPEFRAMARAGEVDGDSVVFDNTVATVGALRAGEWERPLREAWHARAFSVGAAAGG